jgi:hypothetical protein
LSICIRDEWPPSSQFTSFQQLKGNNSCMTR